MGFNQKMFAEALGGGPEPGRPEKNAHTVDVVGASEYQEEPTQSNGSGLAGPRRALRSAWSGISFAGLGGGYRARSAYRSLVCLGDFAYQEAEIFIELRNLTKLPVGDSFLKSLGFEIEDIMQSTPHILLFWYLFLLTSDFFF